MNSPLVSIIIPVFNQWAFSKNCLLSLREHTPGRTFEVIVVDNNSSDMTPDECHDLGHKLFKDRFTYSRRTQNTNFGPGCNHGAQIAQGEFLFFLNNDTTLTPGWLEPLITAFSKNNSLGAVGPLLLYPDSNRVQHLGIAITPLVSVCHLYHQFPSNHPVVLRHRTLQAITGAALFIPKSIFFDCGSFSEEYRNGYEDLELCCQIRKQGLTLECVSDSIIYHHTSQTQGRYDDEAHNTKLFRERCMGCYEPDLHAFWAQDGYETKITKWLHPYPAMSMDHQKSLMPQSDDIESCLEILLKEPMWELGYKKLMRHYQQHNLWEDALDLALLQQHFLNPDMIIEDVLKIAQKMDNHELVEACEEKAKHHKELANSDEIIKQAKLLKIWGGKLNDSILQESYVSWKST